MKSILTLLSIFLLTISFAQDKYSICPDVEGAKEHPIIQKYKNSCIVAYHETKFDRVTFPLSKIRNYDDLAEKEITEEGHITNIIYGINNSENATVLEVYRNYEQALKAAKFKILRAEFGKKEINGGFYSLKKAYPSFGQEGIENYSFLKHNYVRFAMSGHNKNINNDDALFIAKGKKDGKIYTIALYIHLSRTSWKGIANNIFVQVQTIEKEDMETGQVTAASIDEKIKEDGKEIFHDILFDFGSDNIKPESDEIIATMAEFLNNNKEQKFYIVGHTDNVGSLETNKSLSEKRAKAVKERLTSKHNVKPSQVMAYGVGQLSPVASNKTDEGQALNRRVELVEE